MTLTVMKAETHGAHEGALNRLTLRPYSVLEEDVLMSAL